MAKLNGAIGVMDSGIGGLTVVKELQRILPGEDIIYFGDSANCPYGNKTSDQIFELSCNMLKFLGDNGVKCTAIACNTISTMSNRLRPCFDYRIVSIVEEAAKYVIREKLSSVGLIATEFTSSAYLPEATVNSVAIRPTEESFSRMTYLAASSTMLTMR